MLLRFCSAAFFCAAACGGTAPEQPPSTRPVAQNLLIVTIDTAMGHLAGALARPAWIMLPKASDWRWLLERTDSPWYPTVRLFRQRTPGAWDQVIDEVTGALAQELREVEAAA